MLIVIGIVVLLILIYLLALSGRVGRPGLKALRGWRYAHRGLHAEGRPENSMAAFRAALEGGYGIELDIHLLSDGELAVIHDSDLKRITGQEGNVEDLTAAQLKDYHLADTQETIPLFSQVLELYQGKAPLIVELKTAKDNYAALCEAACKMLDDYRGSYCIESFDPRCLLWLKKHCPDVIRGQLAENFLKEEEDAPWLLRFVLTYQLLNWLLRPDFVAYKFEDRKNLSNFLVRRLWKLQGVSWTLRSKRDHDIAEEEGYLPIFEGFIP